MDLEVGNGSGDDGVPASVIREIIRLSLESALPPSDFFRLSAILSDFRQPLPFQDRTPTFEIGLPKSSRPLNGLPTGFQDFDRIVGGLRRSEVTTVVGLPSSGSSTFVQNIVRRLIAGVPAFPAREDIVPSPRIVSFYNLDAANDDVIHRIIASHAKLDWHRASLGFLRDAEWTRLAVAIQGLWDGKLFLTDDRHVSLDTIHEDGMRRKQSMGLDLIVLDRINVLGVDYHGSTPPLKEVMVELKYMAEDLNVPILLTYTAGLETADEETHRQSLYTLPLTVQLCSDVLVLIHRPDYWTFKEIGRERDEAPELQKGLEVVELNVARQTGGPTEMFRLAFNTRWGRFDNLLWNC